MDSAQSKSATISIHHLQTADSKSTDSVIESQPPETLQNQVETNAISEESNQGGDGDVKAEEEEEKEEEEERECGFCLFMKGGGCKDVFVEWEKCVGEGEKLSEDIVKKCQEVTVALTECMKVHSDYYAPLLQVEKTVEAEAARQLEEEKKKEIGENPLGSGRKEPSS